MALVVYPFVTYSATPTYDTMKQHEKVTADSQMKGSDRDIEVTRKLREAIMADDQLSTVAHNIQIITIKNSITLKGRVASKAEKVEIENLARARAGNKRVYNRLTY